MVLADRSEDNGEEIARLNSVLATSLPIITQFFFHSSLLDAIGAETLAARHHAEWFDKMRRFDRVLDRILELGGRPASRDAFTLSVGHDTAEILRFDLRLEEALIAELRGVLASLGPANAADTRSLLADILKSEQQYTDWLRAQLDQLDDNGVQEDARSRASGASGKPGHDPLLSLLNEILRIELSALTQVYYHSRILESRGIKKPHEFNATETYEKTYRSVAILKRLLALDGMPAAHGHGKLMIGGEVREMLNCDLEVQRSLIPLLHNALDHCDSHGDQETGQLLRGILEGEEKHVAWIETQFTQIEQRGIEAYSRPPA